MNNLNPTTSDQGKTYKVSNGLIFLLQVSKENLVPSEMWHLTAHANI